MKIVKMKLKTATNLVTANKLITKRKKKMISLLSNDRPQRSQIQVVAKYLYNQVALVKFQIANKKFILLAQFQCHLILAKSSLKLEMIQ